MGISKINFLCGGTALSISLEKIVQAVRSVKSESIKSETAENGCENQDVGTVEELSPEEKNVVLILESAGFFDNAVDEESVKKIHEETLFVAENIVEIYNKIQDIKESVEPPVCPDCGTVGIKDAVFCYKCGAKIPRQNFGINNLPPVKWRNKFFEVTKVPGFEISVAPITQKIWCEVMGFNPSCFKNYDNPVDGVSWYDAIYFCNCLSEICGYAPCYFVDGKSDVKKWGYIPGVNEKTITMPECNFHANGFRLPTAAEWMDAAGARDNFVYSGSNVADEVAWFSENSTDRTHEVCAKNANGFGLYDMSGNVYEWCWDALDTERYFCGGCWKSKPSSCAIDCLRTHDPSDRMKLFGFRVVRSV